MYIPLGLDQINPDLLAAHSLFGLIDTGAAN